MNNNICSICGIWWFYPESFFMGTETWQWSGIILNGIGALAGIVATTRANKWGNQINIDQFVFTYK